MVGQPASPVAIGALGGSGTRAVAQFLRDAGFYMGGDLNGPNDNLWFTLLFKRPDILVEPWSQFQTLSSVFYSRMTGKLAIDQSTRQAIEDLVERPRPLHKRAWLQDRAATFMDDRLPTANGGAWGWKEPNTHIVVDRLLRLDKRLRYIHVTRNGLDMAFSDNQNQLRLWGSTFLGRDVKIGPRDSLAYWCAVHRRMRLIEKDFAGRIMYLDFDRLCSEPKQTCQELVGFLGIAPPQELIQDFVRKVSPPESIGRFRHHSLSQFDFNDIRFVEEWGYETK